jgi:AbrB family looped-hinge helix DNA binding protein
MKHPLFEKMSYELATLGERGQMVIPAKIRKMLGIKPGSQVLIVCGAKGQSALIINAKYMSKFLVGMRKSLVAVEKKLGILRK